MDRSFHKILIKYVAAAPNPKLCILILPKFCSQTFKLPNILLNFTFTKLLFIMIVFVIWFYNMI